MVKSIIYKQYKYLRARSYQKMSLKSKICFILLNNILLNQSELTFPKPGLH